MAGAVDGRERLDAIRRRILNVVGHELRTPVTTIHGLADALAGADESTIRTTLAPAILRNTQRLERLLDDLLVASEISTALPVEQPEAIDVAPVARAVWADVSAAVSPGTEHSDGSDGAGLAVEGDATVRVGPRAFEQVLQRVLDNAARYGEPPMTMQVSAHAGTVCLTVDTPGPDLHPEEVELALEPFFRGERAVMTGPGIGIGLAVARALVEQAGGRMWVEARAGGGLVTVVELEAA